MTNLASRLDRISERLTPSPTLRRIVERVALENGLEPAVVLAEAEHVLAEAAASGRSVVEMIAAERGVDAEAVRERAAAIMARWEKGGGR